MTLFRKIRERRLFQIGLSYAGGAWVFLSVVDQLVNRGWVPALLYDIGLMWVIVGIPAAMLVGWYHGEKGEQTAPRSEIAALSVLALIGLGLSFSTVTKHRADAQEKAAGENVLETRRLAVMYFDDESADKKYEYLADGLTESLIDALSQIQDLDVVSRNGSAQYRDSDLEPDSIGQLLRVGSLVKGRIEERGEKLRVSFELLSGASGARIGDAVTVERPASDAMALTDNLAAETAVLLRRLLGPEVRLKDGARGTSNTQAWMLVQRAERLRKNAEGLLRAGDAANANAAFNEADGLLAQAEKMDAKWAEPAIARASIAYRQSRLLQRTSRPDALVSAQKGVSEAEEALRRSRTSARALEMRGTLNYWIWLMKVTPDPTAQETLLKGARKDLEDAVEYDPSLASAHATLSHLYFNVRDISKVILAARSAYEADAYLEVADVVLWRLFTGTWQRGEFTDSKRWCAEGATRFAADYRFTSCGLRNMITSAETPDISQAWTLLNRLDSIAPANLKAAEHIRGELLIAGVIARQAAREPAREKLLRDSANAVVNRASLAITPELDPTGELLTFLGVAQVLVGNHDAAITVLETIKARDPVSWEQGKGEVDWYWRGLQGHPKFAALFDLK